MVHDLQLIQASWSWLALALAAGYLCGSIPVGVILTRAMGLGDLRKMGSGSTGATNVLRTGSKTAAALTLMLDLAKGLIPVVLFLNWGDLAAQAAGIGAVLGHCLPVWLGFRGGKGMATFGGVILGLYWPAGLLVGATWLAMVVLTRISSVGALTATVAAPVWLWALTRPEAVLTAAGLAAFIWLRHHANIRRLIAGKEPKIGRGGA